MEVAARRFPVLKVGNAGTENAEDKLAVEEPLEIQLSYFTDKGLPVIQPVSITMRTPVPGQDIELAAGFLLTEGTYGKKKILKKRYR